MVQTVQTVAICTTMKNKPKVQSICPYEWYMPRGTQPPNTACKECDKDCWTKCGMRKCPCDEIKVVYGQTGQEFDLEQTGTYIVLKDKSYTIQNTEQSKVLRVT